MANIKHRYLDTTLKKILCKVVLIIVGFYGSLENICICDIFGVPVVASVRTEEGTSAPYEE